MFALLKNAIVLFSIFAASAIAAASCRLCSGTLTLTLNNFATQANVNNMVRYYMSGCATGLQYQITGYSNPPQTCVQGSNPLKCKSWTVSLKAFRYCGNGGSVSKTFGHNACDGGVCASSNLLTMSCNPSVACADTCDPNYC